MSFGGPSWGFPLVFGVWAGVKERLGLSKGCRLFGWVGGGGGGLRG